MEIESMELDILKEIGSIGSGQAASSLSSILNKKIDVEIQDTKFVPIVEFTDVIGGADKVIVSVYCELTGEISGIIHMIFSRENALKFIDLLLGNPPKTTKMLEEQNEAALKEIANILFGAYLSSMSNMLNVKVLFTTPNMAHDLAGAIVDYSLIKLSTKVDEVLTIKTKLFVSDDEIEGSLVVLFENDSLSKIVSIIKENYLKQK